MNTPFTDVSRTVFLARLEDTPHFRITCLREVDAEDMAAVMHTLQSLLDYSRAPLYVLIDLRANTTFPIHATLSEAVRGPLCHPMMGGWLLVGERPHTAVLGKLMLRLSPTSAVRWFNTEAEALAALGMG
jgi:hypothetical protein